MEVCSKYNYKGLWIYRNISSEFNTEYWTTVNPAKKGKDGHMLHAHACTESSAKMIADCYHRLRNGQPGKYSTTIRNKACNLLGMRIHMK